MLEELGILSSTAVFDLIKFRGAAPAKQAWVDARYAPHGAM
jgi:hypothetical protein